ncbi:acetate--CoA ligase family protein [Massilia putida]|uniref:acetate--CoA ligase family protein n=1 Tax=Massilia putida TaxID=1141883 RepID=UPI0009521362|nr:acetate--CoA ligase family protein [Massilia putida]
MTTSHSSGRKRDLAAFFNPRSIAMVGASERSSWSIGVAGRFRDYGYAGKVFAVNRNGNDAHGYPGFKSCKDIGEPVDFAYLMVPAEVTLDALADAADAGIKHVSILTSGFAETGDAGVEIQDRLLAYAEERGITFMGPNSLGFANISKRTMATSIPTRLPVLDGSVALLSQSGAVVAEVCKFAHQQGVGLSFVAATGNEAQLGLTDVMDYLVDDPATRVIGVFAESIRDPQAFRAAARRALAARKPIVIQKVGKSDISAAIAQAHTGSLVGDDKVFDAVCRQFGVIRVESIEELVATCDLMSRMPPLAQPGIGVVSISGGACGMFADQAQAAGVVLEQFTPQTQARLKEVLPEFASSLNPLDITGAVFRAPEIWEKTLPVVASDPKVGMVAIINFMPATEKELAGLRETVMAMGRGFAACGKPGIVVLPTSQPVGAVMTGIVKEAGLPGLGFGTQLTVRAIAGLVQWSARVANPETTATAHPAESAPASAVRPGTEREVLDFLASRDVPVIPAKVSRSAAEAVAFARDIGGKLALKILSADIQHKTEVGGVKLNVEGDDAVTAAWNAIDASVRQHCPQAAIDGIIVSPMRSSGVELFVGTARDPHWGPVLAVGLGGVWVEVMADTAVRPLPVTPADVKDMLGSLRGARLLQGFRGSKPADLDAVAQAVARIGDAALALGPDLLSLEINPLLVDGDRVEALDGLCVWSQA